MQLRKYQEEAVDAVHKSFSEGLNAVVISMPVGTGKTVVFSEVAKKYVDEGKRVLVIAHFDELLNQAKRKLQDVISNVLIEVEKADEHASKAAHIVLGSVASLGRTGSLRLQDHDFHLIIVDECFVESTLIDNKKISEIKIGDYVNSFNETTKRIEKRKVLSLFKNPVKELIKIKLQNNEEIICTPNHPIYINGKYIEACKIIPGNMVYYKYTYKEEYDAYNNQKLYNMQQRSSKNLLEQKNQCSTMFTRMQRNKKKANSKKSNTSLSKLQKRSRMFWKKTIRTSPKRKSLLFSRMQKRSSEEFVLKNHGRDKQKICLRKNEKEQSNVQSRISGKNETKNDWKNLSITRRKWSFNSTTKEIAPSFRTRHNNIRICNKYKHCKRSISISSELLQSGHWNTRTKNCNRNRWIKSQYKEMEISRQKENFSTKFIRVDSVEILQQSCDGKFGGVCPDGYVYNIEVEGNNNYFANGVLVHNCHHTPANTFVNTINNISKPFTNILGVTATPLRRDKKAVHGGNSIFQKICYQYSLKDAIIQGYLCNIIGYKIETEIDISEVDASQGQLNEAQLEKLFLDSSRNKTIWEQWNKLCPDRKTLMFLPTVALAKEAADFFKSKGVKADFVSGKCKDRKEKLEKFTSGETQFLVNAKLLMEGYDLPEISCVITATPLGFWGTFCQQVGRGTRLFPGKENLIVLDVADNTTKHNLCNMPTMLGLPKTVNISGMSVKEVLESIDESPLSDLELLKKYKIETLPELKSKLKEIAMISLTTTDEEILKYTKLAWISVNDGYYIGKGKDFCKINIDQTGYHNMIINSQGKQEKIEFPGKLESAWTCYEDIIKERLDGYHLLLRDQPWWSDSATTAQKKHLTSLGINWKLWPNLSKGQASRLIDYAYSVGMKPKEITCKQRWAMRNK